ncbi:hypothetical protein CBR_g4216 [Chara braunii]|uniref:Integrase catalytic domain-containing protein n=1 Tax=Chara braunii TaxID=69332 RepID=A0A388JR63_CHABU|nr:hypothetical protein CBR_g4216 [Chara braunii]|eukprot:GBG60263.1 hypothetical protein CBR_g4216 [Chara braunii]
MEEHLEHLEEVLAILKKTQLHLNLEKSEFGKDSVIYLGHRLSAAGLEPEATKIEVIRDWPRPANIRGLRSFVGLALYYRKFVPRFSIIARPLSRLTSKNVPYSWDAACTEAFRALKEALVSYTVLRIADLKLTFVVTTDASQYGIGTALQQDDGDGLRPLEYYSKRMPNVKVATSTYMWELYALRMALDHWKHYLLGRHFKVVSYHETLKWIKQQTTLSPTLLRWFHEIDIFDFELRHKKDLGIREFQQKYILQFGTPKTLVSDRDPRFISTEWKDFTSHLGIKLCMTSGRHPEANGLAEEINQTVFQLLRALIIPDQETWDEELYSVKGLYNNSIHSATAMTPNRLHYGWQIRNPLAYLFPEQPAGLTPGRPGFKAKYDRLLKVAIAAMTKRQRAMIHHANKKCRPSEIQVGSYVWVKMSEFLEEEGVSRKLLPLYYGPWEVLDVIGEDHFGPSYVVDVPAHLCAYPAHLVLLHLVQASFLYSFINGGLGPGEERRLRREARERAAARRNRDAAASLAAAMATVSSTSQSTSQSSSSGAGQGGSGAVSQSIGLQVNQQALLTPEDIEIQKVEELQDELRWQLDEASERRRKAIMRKARLESRMEALGRLEDLDEATLEPAGRVLRNAVLSIAEAQTVQQELLTDLVAGQKRILDALQAPRPVMRQPQFVVVPPAGAGPSTMPRPTGQSFSPMFDMPPPCGVGVVSGPVQRVSAVPSTTVVTTVPLSSQAQFLLLLLEDPFVVVLHSVVLVGPSHVAKVLASQVIVYRQPRYQRHHYSAQRKWNPFCSWSNKGLDDVDNQKQRQEQGRSGKHSLPKKMPEWLAERERNGPIQGIQMEHVVVQLNSSRFVERMILSLSQRAIEQLPCVSDMALACALSMKVADATITRSGGSTDLQTLPNRVSRSNDKDLQYESSPDKQGNRHVDLVNQPGDKKRSWGKVKRRRRGHAVDPFSGKEEQKGSEEFVGWRIICLLVQVAHCFTLGALAAVVALVQASIWIVLTMLLPVAGLLGEWSDTWHAVVHRHAELSLGSMALKSCLERQLLEAYCLLGSSSKGGRDRKAEARIKREAWDVREAHMSALRNHGLQAEMLADMVLGMVAGILLRWQKDVVCQLLMGMGSDVSTGLMKTGMVWLMGVPAGFKLNNELANCTGRVSLYLIHGWATLCSSLVVPVLPMILDVVAVAGLSGLSVLLSLLGDLLALATCHMALLYGAMAVVYTPQLQAAGALWRMFRGQKRNPLRHRVDSYECSVEQSLVGCLMFTPLLLLLPTTSIFYIFFTVTYGAVLAIRGGLRVVLALLRGFPFFAAGVWLLLGRGWFPSGMWFKVLELERELVASGLSRKRVHVSDRVAAEKMVYPNSYLENVEIQGNSVFQGKALQAKGKVPLEHSESLGTRVLRSREGNGPKSRMGESGDGGTRNCCHIYDGKDQDRESRTERDWRDQDKTVRSSGVEEGGMATHKEMCCMDGVSMGDDCETMKGCEPERRQKSKAFARAAFENDCPRPSDSGMETENRKYIQQCVAREAIYIVVNCNGASLVPRQPQCHVSSATSATVPHQQCHVSHSATSAVPRQPQCHISSAALALPRQPQCHVSMTGPALGLPGQLANESIADYKQRFQAQLVFIEAEEQRQLAAEAARLQAEAAATAEKLRLQAEADADAQARRKEAQDLLQRHEANNIERLKFWHFEPNGDDATPEEQHKEFLSKLVTRLLYACNYQRSELERQNQELQQQYQDLKTQHQELANLRRIVQSHEDATRALNSRVLDLEQAVPGPDAGASSSAPSSRQLEERVDHVVAMLGDISSQLDTLKTEVQQMQSTNSDGNPKLYKMPTFQLEKFDDYTHQDLVLWWEAFTTQLRILPPPTAKTSQISQLHQGDTATCGWLTEWQKIAAVPDLDLPFTYLRREFYNRSCAALSQALGDREQYATFAEIIDKEREIIKTNRAAAHERSTWQPTYVEKVKTGPRPQHFAAVQSDSGEDPAATPASRDEDQVAAVQPRSNNKSRNNGKAKPASQAGNGQPAPWVKFSLTEAEYKYRGRYGCCYCFAGGEATSPSTPPDSAALLAASNTSGEDAPSTAPDSAALLAASNTSGEDANVVSSRYTYEDYAVHLVPPLDQPLHVQQSTACTVSSPSASDSAASPPSIAGDSSSWSRLEEPDPLTFAHFQWMPVPSTRRLPKPHCNVLMAQLRDYLHTAVPTPLMDAGVEVVDLLAYIAKIDRKFKTQWYDDIDAPLLYVRIQIGEATCSALIDCGASRNYMSQDFMVRAGLGPRVRRKSQPTQVTLADGHMHKSIDRCINDVPVYFAPHASEAVSFDILDTKFDMILGMSWLRSEDHPVNFYRRTVHVRDRNEIIVPCTVPLPHPWISCHVVSAASMQASIIRDDIEEMGVCFLHALPPHDASSTDSSSDPRITELLDAYSDVFEGPHGVVPDRPIHHEIILEDGAVPPRSCIYRMSEEELSVLRAQLDDLLEKGWIRPSSSPYGAPVLFTIRNVGPLPRIDDLLERLGGAKFFSKLDLKSGYHQLEIRQEDRYYTAFKTRYGHLEWLVMPFGLTNAPATFQAAITTEFRQYVLIYLDDILVYSRSLDEHVEQLRTVLEWLRQGKYKANRDKCESPRQELVYLGHYVTPQGIRLLADKIEALRVWPEPTNTTDVRSFMGLAGYYQRFIIGYSRIAVWPEPTNTTDVRSFMGLAGYYQRFIIGYSRIAAPLTRLQSPKVPFVFDDDARWSFQTLKTAMLMAPVLTPPCRRETRPSTVSSGLTGASEEELFARPEDVTAYWLFGRSVSAATHIEPNAEDSERGSDYESLDVICKEEAEDADDMEIRPLPVRGRGRGGGVHQEKAVSSGGRRSKGPTGEKGGKHPSWSVEEMLKLARAKRDQQTHFEGMPHNYKRIRNREWKLQDLQKHLLDVGLNRTIDDIDKKWDNLFQQYKKVQRRHVRGKTIYPDNVVDTSTHGGLRMPRSPSIVGESATGGDGGDGNDDKEGSARESDYSAGSTEGNCKRKNVRQQTFDAIVEVMGRHVALMADTVEGASKRQCSILERLCDILEREVDAQGRHYEASDEANRLMCTSLLEIIKAIRDSVVLRHATISLWSPAKRMCDLTTDLAVYVLHVVYNGSHF